MRAALALLGLAAAGCTPAEVAAPDVAPTALDRLREQAPHARWHYDVLVDDNLETLTIEAMLERTEATRLGVDRPGGYFVDDVEVMVGRNWRSVPDNDGVFDVTACSSRCRLRYRFALAAAADRIRDAEVADRSGQAVLSPPSAWLLRPGDDDAPFTFAVRGAGFISGVWPDPTVPGAYGGDSGHLWRSPYSAFGGFTKESLTVGESTIDVAFLPGEHEVARAEALGWIEASAKTVAAYFGRYPVPRVLVLVAPTSGARIHGRQIGGGGVSIILTLGAEAGPIQFAHDWVAVHEMIHLAVPAMPRRNLWLTEGLATYLEPLARARRGEIAVERVWRDMVEGMDHGLPEAGDAGLDNTPTWGRIYWGGALFALIADLEIRKRTDGRKSLDDGLRAVVAAGGNNGVFWSMDRFVAVVDQATETDVLASMVARWANEPVPVDLQRLWADLGVRSQGDSIVFDDDAPLAAQRLALTAP
jgi:hypothetical protein